MTTTSQHHHHDHHHEVQENIAHPTPTPTSTDSNCSYNNNNQRRRKTVLTLMLSTQNATMVHCISYRCFVFSWSSFRVPKYRFITEKIRLVSKRLFFCHIKIFAKLLRNLRKLRLFDQTIFGAYRHDKKYTCIAISTI